MAKDSQEIKLKIVVDVRMSDEVREFFNLSKEEVDEPPLVEPNLKEALSSPVKDSDWYFQHNRGDRPVIVVMDKTTGVYDTLHPGWHIDELQDLCSAYDIDYGELAKVIDSAIQTGSYMVYIDMDQYRASRLDQA